ncbi:unnamed protein product, partial [Cladocopium goreaui]
TKSSYLAGRRRYNGGCTAYTKRPQAPICGPSGTGFAVAANQCHIIVNGECWVGQFAVWRFPVMQPSDIQFTSNPILLKFLDFTPSGTEVPKFNAARAHVEGLVEKSSPTRLRSIMQYREHCLHVPTPQIRGLLTALAERAQQQVFDASDPERDAALIHCVRLAVAAEKAYDAPKKVDAKSIIQLGRRLLREAGLTIQSPRSTQRIREAFKLGRVHKEAHIALHALLPRIPLGKAWLPLNKVTLSAAAGHAIRDRMFHPKCMNGLADPLEHMALDEVAGVLFHHLASVPNLRSSVQVCPALIPTPPGAPSAVDWSVWRRSRLRHAIVITYNKAICRQVKNLDQAKAAETRQAAVKKYGPSFRNQHPSALIRESNHREFPCNGRSDQLCKARLATHVAVALDFWCLHHFAYSPSQFEYYALFKKGISPAWQDEDRQWQLLLRKSTAKLRYAAGVDGAEEHLGLDIVQAHGQRGRLCATALGSAAACCLPAADHALRDRERADSLLKKFLTEGKKAFVEQNARTAWGLARHRARPPTVQQVVRDPRERASAAAAARQVDLLAADRTSQHRVDYLLQTHIDAEPWRIDRGAPSRSG